MVETFVLFFFFSSIRRHTRYWRDWSSDVCSSDLERRVDLPTGDQRTGWRDAAALNPDRREAREMWPVRVARLLESSSLPIMVLRANPRVIRGDALERVT